MYTCIHIHTHTHIQPYVSAYTCNDTSGPYMFTQLDSYTHIYMHICVHTYIHTPNVCTFHPSHIHTCWYLSTYTHVRVCAYTPTCKHTTWAWVYHQFLLGPSPTILYIPTLMYTSTHLERPFILAPWGAIHVLCFACLSGLSPIAPMVIKSGEWKQFLLG